MVVLWLRPNFWYQKDASKDVLASSVSAQDLFLVRPQRKELEFCCCCWNHDRVFRRYSHKHSLRRPVDFLDDCGVYMLLSREGVLVGMLL